MARLGRVAAAALVLSSLASLAGLAASVSSADPTTDPHTEQVKARFAAARRRILFEAGTERVRLGEWCRNAGLVAQASACFVRAVEESEGENWWAKKVLDLMRKLDDKFWKTVVAHPTKQYLDTFDHKAR